MKTKIEKLIQFFLMEFLFVQGFIYTYCSIWCAVGLPVKWWSVVIWAVIGLLSTYGFNQWVCRERRTDG